MKKKESKLEKDRKKENMKLGGKLKCWLDKNPHEENNVGICESKAENKTVKKVNNLIGKFEKLEAAAELQNQNVQSKSTVRLEKNSAKNILEVDTALRVGKSK